MKWTEVVTTQHTSGSELKTLYENVNYDKTNLKIVLSAGFKPQL